MNRRDFCKGGLLSLVTLLTGCGLRETLFEQGSSLIGSPSWMPRETMFYEKQGDEQVRCRTCHRNCRIPLGRRGFCGARENHRGSLYSVVYGFPPAVSVSPIEKEPQYHYLPGSNILCVGTVGCNFTCKYCQNWNLSQRQLEDLERYHTYQPREIVDLALERDTPTISFTYNEPTVLYEYMYDISVLARERGLKVLVHSNGFMNPEPLKLLLPQVDAVTVDLKGFTQDFYQEVTGGKLEPVLENLMTIKEQKVWLELVNLVVPSLNDDLDTLKIMCRWITHNLGDNTPLHFSRFVPSYKLTNTISTPVKTLEMAYETAKQEGLKYVTIGNVPGHRFNSSYCPVCDSILIERHHFAVKGVYLNQGHCMTCGEEIPGIWS